ncbi:hypothetical protein DLAC_03275 [Tieghemostelium lacteum]|uniref:Uncharacterized protein n=1 Tax=Tieghemostelium lacteum TaxID=361077 RepID=A0A152A1J0_TIELA|nr:hypothetical protein DLAC_03275 [Tieghemostelium lacteum]|eukprot:KYR00123.1 hypothetical protein DLAC_03275 [Tieghemostelium lacteum]
MVSIKPYLKVIERFHSSPFESIFIDCDAFNQFLDGFFKWIHTDIDWESEDIQQLCRKVISHIMKTDDHLLHTERIIPLLESIMDKKQTDSGVVDKKPISKSKKKGKPKKEEIEIDLKDYHILNILSNPSKSLLLHYYNNGYLIKMFQRMYPRVINNLFASMKTYSLFSPNKPIQDPISHDAKVDQAEGVYYNPNLLPMSLIVEALENKSIELSDNFYMVIITILKSFYPATKDFTVVDPDSYSNFKMNEEFVRYLLRIAQTDDIEKAQNFHIEFIVRFICLNTFQNITKSEIMKLKKEYLSLVPYIFKYNQISDRLQKRWVHYRRRSFRGRYYKSYKLKSHGHSNLSFYKLHFGVNNIEQHAIDFFRNSTEKISLGTARDILNAIGALNSIGLDSKAIELKIQPIYQRLVKAILVSRHKELLNQVSTCLSILIFNYKEFPATLANDLLDYLTKQENLFGMNLINEKNKPSYELFTAVCVGCHEVTMERFGEIFGYLVDGHFYNRVTHFKQILMSLNDQFSNLENMNEYYKEIEDFYKQFESPELFECLLHFSKDLKHLQELVGLNMGHKYSTLEYKRLLLKLFKALGCDIQYIWYLDHFLSDYNCIISSEEAIDTLFEIMTTPEEVELVFERINLNILNTNIQGQAFNIYKYYMGIDGLLATKYFSKLIEEWRGEIFRDSKKHQQKLSFLRNACRFINVDNVAQQLIIGIQNGLFFKSSIEDIGYLISTFENLNEFYLKFIENFDEKSEFSSEIIPLHRKITSLITLSSDIHLKFIDKCISYPEFNSVDIEKMYIFLDFFKEISDTVSPQFKEIEKKFLHHFNNESVGDTLTQRKRLVLKYIATFHPEMVKNQLSFLFDSTKTNYHYKHEEFVIEFHSSSATIQNTIIQNILRFLIIGVKKESLASLLLRCALVSKSFFSVCINLFKNYPIEKQLIPKYNYSGAWSLLQKGVYNLKYSELGLFDSAIRIERFYQISQLNIDSELWYRVDREMVNLFDLTIQISSFNLDFNAAGLFYSSLKNLINHCYYLISFKMEVKSGNIDFTEIVNIINILLNQNKSLKSLSLFVSLDRPGDKTIKNELEQTIAKHQTPEDFKFEYKQEYRRVINTKQAWF